MKITFVSPPVTVEKQLTPYPPLGVGNLSAVLKNYFGSEVRIEYIDGQLLGYESFWNKIGSINSDFLMLSSTMRQMKDCSRISRIVKSTHPNTFSVMGGVGPTALFYQGIDLSAFSDIDLLVVGEAEPYICKIVDTHRKINFLHGYKNARLHEGSPPVLECLQKPELQSLGWPDRSIFDMGAYLDRWQECVGMTSVHLMGSRGCPYTCRFCDKSVTGNITRFREPQDIAQEMGFLDRRFNPTDIYYFDDLFAITHRRVADVCAAIQDQKLKAGWSAQGRVNTVTREMLAILANSGCKELYFGVESGSPKILSYFNKNTTPDQIIHAFDVCHEFGIKPGAYVIVGVPGETNEDIKATIDIIRRIKPALLTVTLLTPYPNTALFDELRGNISNWDFSIWDDLERSVITYNWEIDPISAREMVMNAYREMIREGLDRLNYVPNP